MDTPLLVEEFLMEEAYKLCDFMLAHGVNVWVMFLDFDKDRSRYYLCVSAETFESDRTQLESYDKLNEFIRQSGVRIRLEDTKVLSGKMDSYAELMAWDWQTDAAYPHIKNSYTNGHYTESAYLIYANKYPQFGEKWGPAAKGVSNDR
jgi:hypothetical protein